MRSLIVLASICNWKASVLDHGRSNSAVTTWQGYFYYPLVSIPCVKYYGVVIKI